MSNLVRITTVLVLMLFAEHALAQWIRTNEPNGGTPVLSLVLKGTDLVAGTPQAGVYLSTNNGGTWTQAGLSGNDVNCFTTKGLNLIAGTTSGIHITTNNGSNWTQSNSGLSYFMAGVIALATIDTNVLAGTEFGVFFSSNNGQSWTSTNLTGIVNAIAVKDTLAFAGTGNGTVFLSTNNGVSWASASNGLGTNAIFSLAAGDINLYAGTSSGEIFRSTNSGGNWTDVSPGATSSGITSLLAGSVNLLAGTLEGVFLSTNNGTTWDSVNTNLVTGYGYVKSFVINWPYLFAGSTYGGIWKRTLSEIVTSVSTIAPPIPTRPTLQQNYPNPFNPTTTISFTLPSKGFVSLKIFDIVGSKIADLMSMQLDPGVHTVDWTPSHLPSGIYFYTIESGSYSETKKLVLLK